MIEDEMEEVEIMMHPEASEEDVAAYLEESFVNACAYIMEGAWDEESYKDLVAGYLYLYKNYYVPSKDIH